METDFNKYQGLSHDSKIMITQLSNLLQPNPEQRITMHDLSLVEEFTDILKLPDRMEEVQSNIARVVLQQRVNDGIHRQAWLKNSQGVKQNSVNSRPGSDTTNISDSSFEEQPTKAFRNPFAASNANSIHSNTQFESNNDDDGTSIASCVGNLGKLNNNGSVGQSVGNNGRSASIQSLGQEIKKNQQMAVIDALDFEAQQH